MSISRRVARCLPFFRLIARMGDERNSLPPQAGRMSIDGRRNLLSDGQGKRTSIRNRSPHKRPAIQVSEATNGTAPSSFPTCSRMASSNVSPGSVNRQ